MQPTAYPEHTVGRLMEPPVAVFPPAFTVREATDHVRALSAQRMFTYGYVVDSAGRLLGVVTMRDLLLHGPDERLEQFMLREPFALRPETDLLEAMRQTLDKHFPYYPVCDARGVLVGVVRGSTIFEQETIEISAQAGRMVGVESEEHASTPFATSFRHRHPWLQFNLITALAAAAVVGAFESTIARITALAVFLPVLAGQSGNTGCQAMAVALRGLTLGELHPAQSRHLLLKEAGLGLANGLLVGLTAGVAMYAYASWHETGQLPALLAGVVLLAMTASCVVSGVSGVLVPLTLKRLGFDPATASAIFLTTATDVASMACFLGLARLWIP
ncbi:MAG TPA: magnesium transporter [Candidatus Limnocylindria bacterium]|nr:magnesium transporter [Candidatus Limnocylindria bacterium]